MKNQASRSSTGWSLATILTLALIALSFGALLIETSVQSFSTLRMQEASIASNQQLIARDAASQVSGFIEQQFGALETAIRITDSAATGATWERTLQGLVGLYPSFKHLVLLNNENQPIARASRVSMAASDQFIAQLNGGLVQDMNQPGRFIGSVLIDPLTSEPQVIIAVPAVNMLGERYGTIVGVVNLKFMWDLVSQLQIGESGYAYVVDRQGNLLAFNDTSRVLRGENVAQIQAVREFIVEPSASGSGEMSSYTGVTNAMVVGSYVPLGQPDWAVVTEMPREEAYREVTSSIMLSGGLLVGTVILASGLGFYIARRLTTPIINLMNTATRIAEGEHDLQVQVGGPHEIAQLGIAFNGMTAQLRSAMEGLEQRVAQRTADLQHALAEVEARSIEQERLLNENVQQRQFIREMSVPILPVTRDTLVMPLIGALDTERLNDLQQQALHALQHSAARRLLVDITGVPVVDTQVAHGLLAVAQMARLLGAEVVLIGIRPEVAQTIVGLGIDLSMLSTKADLQTALNNYRKN